MQILFLIIYKFVTKGLKATVRSHDRIALGDLAKNIVMILDIYSETLASNEEKLWENHFDSGKNGEIVCVFEGNRRRCSPSNRETATRQTKKKKTTL